MIRRRGFTLIELLCVLGALAVLSNLYLYLDSNNDGLKESIRLAYDEDDGMLVIDKMNGTEKLIVSEGISRIVWETVHNGIKYTAYETPATGMERVLFFGYAVKRGR